MSAIQTIVANAGPKSKQKAKSKAKEQSQAKSNEVKPKCDCAIQLTGKKITEAILAGRQVFKVNGLFYTQCNKSKLNGENYCKNHLNMINDGKEIINFSMIDGEEIKDVNDPSIHKKRGPKKGSKSSPRKTVNTVPDELQDMPELIERFNQETAEVDNAASAKIDAIKKEASLNKDEIKKRLIQEAIQRDAEQASEQEVSSEEETEELIVEDEEPKSEEDEEPKSEEDEEPKSASEKEVPIKTLLTISDKQGREFKLVNNTVYNEDDEMIGELMEVSYIDAPIELKGKNYIISEIINFKDEEFILDKLTQSVYKDNDGTIDYHGKTKTNSKGKITKIIAVKSK